MSTNGEIWVLVYDCYEYYWVVAAFDSEQKAEAALKEQERQGWRGTMDRYNDHRIEAIPLNPSHITTLQKGGENHEWRRDPEEDCRGLRG